MEFSDLNIFSSMGVGSFTFYLGTKCEEGIGVEKKSEAKKLPGLKCLQVPKNSTKIPTHTKYKKLFRIFEKEIIVTNLFLFSR